VGLKVEVDKERLLYLRNEALRLSVELRSLMVRYEKWRGEAGDYLMLLVNVYRWLVEMSEGNDELDG
jgi:hypothetical protein